ncbi:tetratricopeptide repeat protein [Anaerobacillus sp. HL2]|nr:tetratricopeptide repeat protein [Anaerobacillus sp. HL2]
MTIDQRPFLHEAHYNLSLVYYELRQYLDAFHSVQSAIELEPNNEDYQQLKNTIETHLKKG